MFLEAKDSLWRFHNIGDWICITTNGFVKKNGEAVMGAGCALEAKRKYPLMPFRLGQYIKAHGNNAHIIYLPREIDSPDVLLTRIITFPVKNNWYEKADLEIIKRSAQQVKGIWDNICYNNNTGIPSKLYIPRPGCGNGKLDWADVKPILEPIFDDRFVIISKENE